MQRIEDMKRMLKTGEALDVRREGRETAVEGVYELRRFVEDKAYVDLARGRYIVSVGQGFFDNRIFASCDTRFADNCNYSTLYLR